MVGLLPCVVFDRRAVGSVNIEDVVLGIGCNLGSSLTTTPRLCLAPFLYVPRLLTVCVLDILQYIIRCMNTNIDGKEKVMYALTKIRGVGRRFSNMVCKKADVDMGKR